jgi:hypothetical protein
MYYAVNILMLGYTRLAGVTAYNSETRNFDEITPAVARKLIAEGRIKGILWKNTVDGGEFVPDIKEFNQQNILVKTAVGKFRPLLNDHVGIEINSMYTVVRKILTDYRGILYEIVSNKAGRVKVTEKQLRELNEITNIAGVFINDDDIIICDGVALEDRKVSAKDFTVEVDIDRASTEPAVDDVEITEVDEKATVDVVDANVEVKTEEIATTETEEIAAVEESIEEQPTKKSSRKKKR